MDYSQNTKLDKSYRILKGLICVDAQSWMLMRTIYDFVLRSYQKGPPQSITPLAQVLPGQGISKKRRR